MAEHQLSFLFLQQPRCSYCPRPLDQNDLHFGRDKKPYCNEFCAEDAAFAKTGDG